MDETVAFFYFFPCELYNWMSRLLDGQGTWRLDDTILWTLEMVKFLEASKNNITWVVNDWIDRILGGFITELTIDTPINYNEAECIIFKGSRGKYLKSMKTWIEMLLCEK